ncbi:gp53-like domain-containing protein [Citrobacter koseri]|uniref:gp53-like domain-containing protein n=1 Tax=Citrobacter koseri TaxID=545 RepID=UPI0039790F3A
MAKNDFKPFATGNGANVLTQAEYEALAALASGFTSGKASSAQINKAIRQATVIASVIAQFTADNGGSDVLDNGNTAAILASFITALNTSVGNSLGSNFLRKTNNLSDISNATTSRQNLSAAKSGVNSDITALNGLTTPLTVPQGGTGATSAVNARANLFAAQLGANSDITSLNGLTTALSIDQGGTGAKTAANARSNIGAAASGSNSDITAINGLTTALSVPQGGTGSSSAAGARANLFAAQLGANSDITSLSGLTTALSVTQGGTGAKTATAARANLYAGGIPTALNSAQGWWKCADTGRIFQHGKVAITSGSWLTFPIAFPNACFAVILTDNDGYKGVGLLGATTTYAAFTSGSGGTVTVGYLAIGY